MVATLSGALTLGAVAEAAGPGTTPGEVAAARLELAAAGDASPEVLDDRAIVARLRIEAAERDQARWDAFVADLIGDVVRELSTTTTTTAPPPTTAPPTTAPPTTAPPTTAAPAPAPAPAPSGSALEAIAAWFPDAYDAAVYVARCESGLNPAAMSPGGGNHGLFQINNVHAGSFAAVTGQSWDARYNAYYNAQFARYLYDSSGWRPWACRP